MPRKTPSKPRVGILGAGFPARILGRALSDKYEVELFGKPEAAGVLSSMGPRHLWHVEGLDERRYPELSMCGVATAYVRFVHQEGVLAEVHIDERRGTHLPFYEGYWTKVNGAARGNPPCRGLTSYKHYFDGWDALANDLGRGVDLNIAGTEIVSMHEEHGTFSVQTTVGKFTEYAALVTTLRPDTFAVLSTFRGAAMYEGPPPFPRLVHYGWSKRPPASLPVSNWTGPTNQALIYSGRPSDLWHRCSTTPAGWCYEFGRHPRPEELALLGIDSIVTAPTRVSGGLTPFRYHAKIVPVGRYAEWDQELMVSDVLRNCGKYMEEVRRAVNR